MEDDAIEVIKVYLPSRLSRVVVTRIVAGPQGIPGPSGAGGTFHESEFMAQENGEQSVELAAEPGDLQLLSINGLLQPSSAYSIVGATLSIAEDVGIIAGDQIKFTFSGS